MEVGGGPSSRFRRESRGSRVAAPFVARQAQLGRTATTTSGGVHHICSVDDVSNGRIILQGGGSTDCKNNLLEAQNPPVHFATPEAARTLTLASNVAEFTAVPHLSGSAAAYILT